MDATNFLGTSGSGCWIRPYAASIPAPFPSRSLCRPSTLSPPVWSCGWPAWSILFLTGRSCMAGAGILCASSWFYGLPLRSRARPDLRIRLLMWPSRIGLRWTFFGPSRACIAVLYSLAPVPFVHSPACTGILSGAAQSLPSTLPLVCPCMVLRTNSSRLYPTCMAGLYGPVSDFT